VLQTKLASSLVNFRAHYKIVRLYFTFSILVGTRKLKGLGHQCHAHIHSRSMLAPQFQNKPRVAWTPGLPPTDGQPLTKWFLFISHSR